MVIDAGNHLGAAVHLYEIFTVADLDRARDVALDLSGWGRRFVFYQPRNFAFWGYLALVGIGVRDLQEAPETIHDTLMCLLKTHEDRARFKPEVTARLLGKVA